MGVEPVKVVAAACDGACSGNPGPGGWGALLRFADGSVRELGGADPATTNNRMELTAALALLRELRELPRHPDLVIRTDSRYLIDGLERWIHGWKRKGWRTASGGHGLSLVELAQLVQQPLRSLEQRSTPFPWRDWMVEPLADGRWRLRRETSGLADRQVGS